MNTKQQVATGILAMMIVGSITLMPMNPEVTGARASAPSGNIVAALTSPELPQDQVKDLTYN
ncbi:MAG: hypothetical protein ABI789_14850 [Usitatibacter sp.]